MESVVHLDTHVLVWLYAGDLDRVPVEIRKRLESDALQISPAVILELEYLYEIRRVTEPPGAVVADLAARLGLTVSDVAFQSVIAMAVDLVWTRDPFDRLIVAQSQAQGVPLITADKLIRKHYKAALWARTKR